MKVEIWSDIACPWCYIGRRRFETALANFPHRDQVEIVWRSFQLDPTAPKDQPERTQDMLKKRYNLPDAKVKEMQDNVTHLAELEGLEYHLDKTYSINSMDAHRVLHLAKEKGVQGEMKERIQRAYFTEGLLLSDADVLVKLAEEVGLDGAEVRAMLATNEHVSDVQDDIRRAQMIGVQGVPFFLVDERYAVSGAQPAELFGEALDRAWKDAHPVMILSTDESGETCEPGGNC